MLQGLGAKALLYVGDPLRMVDSLFAQWGEQASYLLAEGRAVFAPRFLSRFCRRDFKRILEARKRISRLRDQRQKDIAHRVLVAGLVEHMFRVLAGRYPQQAMLVEFSQLEGNPYYLEDIIRRLLGDAGLEIARTVTSLSTFKPENRDTLVWQNSWPEQAKFSHYLTESEVHQCRDLLHTSGLISLQPSSVQAESEPGVGRNVAKTA